MYKSKMSPPSFASIISVHFFSFFLGISLLLLLWGLRGMWPLNIVAFLAWEAALILNMASAVALILQFRQHEYDDHHLQGVLCAYHSPVDTSESGQDVENADNITCHRTASHYIRDFMRGYFLFRSSTSETKIGKSIVSNAAIITVVATSLLVYLHFEFSHVISQHQRQFMIGRTIMLISWIYSSIYSGIIRTDASHSFLGMLIFCLYLLTDMGKFGANSDGLLAAVIFSLDIVGLAIQAVRWSAATTSPHADITSCSAETICCGDTQNCCTAMEDLEAATC